MFNIRVIGWLDKKSRGLDPVNQDQSITKTLFEGVKAFYYTAYPLIPVWTGQARGSMLTVARLIGEYDSLTGEIMALRKTEQNGKDMFTGANKSDFIVYSKKGIFGFEFKTEIVYFEGMDITFWHSIEAGSDAARKKIYEMIKGGIFKSIAGGTAKAGLIPSLYLGSLTKFSRSAKKLSAYSDTINKKLREVLGTHSASGTDINKEVDRIVSEMITESHGGKKL